MASQLESDVVALVRKLIAGKKTFKISLVNPESPAIKNALAPGQAFGPGCAQCDDDICIEQHVDSATGRCICTKCLEKKTSADRG
jgi:hypothetical protein